MPRLTAPRLTALPRWIVDYAIVGLLAVGVAAWIGWPRGAALSGEAPAVRLTRTDGVDFDLARQRGRPVLLVFWAEWCGTCKTQVPDLNRLQAERPDVEILGIAVDSGPNEHVALHARKHGILFPVAAADEQVAQLYKVPALPTNVFIDAEGQIADSVVGALDLRGFERRLP